MPLEIQDLVVAAQTAHHARQALRRPSHAPTSFHWLRQMEASGAPVRAIGSGVARRTNTRCSAGCGTIIASENAHRIDCAGGLGFDARGLRGGDEQAHVIRSGWRSARPRRSGGFARRCVLKRRAFSVDSAVQEVKADSRDLPVHGDVDQCGVRALRRGTWHYADRLSQLATTDPLNRSVQPTRLP